MAGELKEAKSHDPIGTLDELEAAGIDPTVYRSCAISVGPREVRGCPYFRVCEFPYKGHRGPVGGPHNHGVLHITSFGQSDTVGMACFHFMALVNDHRQCGEVYEVVADEGDTILTKGTKEIMTPVPGARPKYQVLEEPYELVIPAFPRPHENPILASERYNAGVMPMIEQKIMERRLNRIARLPVPAGIQVPGSKGEAGGVPVLEADAPESAPIVRRRGRPPKVPK